MWLGGDPEAIRHSATRLRALVDAVGADHVAAERRLHDVHWESAAADSFRRQAVADFARYAQATEALEEAVRCLDHLAVTLESRQHALADLATRAGRTVEELWSEAATSGHDVLTFAAHAAARAEEDVAHGLSAAGHALGHLLGGAR